MSFFSNCMDFAEDEIIRHCCNPPQTDILHQMAGGRSVVRFKEIFAVKFGFGVTEQEASNLQRACELVDQASVKVPQFFKFFEARNGIFFTEGYLVMEYVPGSKIAIPDHKQIQQLLDITRYLFSIPGTSPGSLTGARLSGNLFQGAENLPPGRIDLLERWINRRSMRPAITLHHLRLGLCHLDIAPRNTLWLAEGHVCILDWESAAFLPRIFEYCSHQATGSDAAQFHSEFLQSTVTKEEREIKTSILAAWHNSIRYFWPEDNSAVEEMATQSPCISIGIPPPPPKCPPSFSQ